MARYTRHVIGDEARRERIQRELRGEFHSDSIDPSDKREWLTLRQTAATLGMAHGSFHGANSAMRWLRAGVRHKQAPGGCRTLFSREDVEALAKVVRARGCKLKVATRVRAGGAG